MPNKRTLFVLIDCIFMVKAVIFAAGLVIRMRPNDEPICMVRVNGISKGYSTILFKEVEDTIFRPYYCILQRMERRAIA